VRERERESLVYAFFLYSTPQCERQNDGVLGAVAIFFFLAYILIVNVTSMNILCLLSTNSRF
jgi:hypothetical protein